MIRLILILLGAAVLAGCVTMTQSTFAQMKDAYRSIGYMECLAARKPCACEEGK